MSLSMLFKRIFDFVISFMLLIMLLPIIIILWIITSVNTKRNGLFNQLRIGQFGKPFRIYKLRTFNSFDKINYVSSVIRRLKLDELPQLWNVIVGDMSLVGPRPDVPGYYDKLEGEDRKILNLKPGITSEASIKYKNEEAILKGQSNPLKYNDEVIFPDKVKMNLEYYYKRTFFGDIKIILKTFIK